MTAPVLSEWYECVENNVQAYAMQGHKGQAVMNRLQMTSTTLHKAISG